MHRVELFTPLAGVDFVFVDVCVMRCGRAGIAVVFCRAVHRKLVPIGGWDGRWVTEAERQAIRWARELYPSKAGLVCSDNQHAAALEKALWVRRRYTGVADRYAAIGPRGIGFRSPIEPGGPLVRLGGGR